jgi:histidinol-phosphate aminotransferase
MSRFLSSRNAGMDPYTPGEQPQNRKYIKLNTNESPFPPSPKAVEMASRQAESYQLYSDPNCTDLVKEGAEFFGVNTDEVLFTNGSDEILDFAFRAFCSEDFPAYFPDITYGFYTLFSRIHRLPFREIPLTEDFEIDLNDYRGLKGMVVIANPNAPTGIAKSRAELEAFIAEDPERLVVVDEAYIDFGGETCVPLIKKYDNLIVTQTFSKSRSMAGARLGMGFACAALIADMNAIKFSANPYNVNRATMAAGIGALQDVEYFEACCSEICRVREWFAGELKALGFSVLPSSANFVFAKSSRFG